MVSATVHGCAKLLISYKILVPQKNTSEAIQSVCTASETTVSGPLPCSATQNTLTKEMKSLSRQQVFEAASQATNVTLK